MTRVLAQALAITAAVGALTTVFAQSSPAVDVQSWPIREGVHVLVGAGANTTIQIGRDGVLDELRLLVHPIVVGKGQRLFDGAEESTGLELLSTRTIANGVLYQVYGPAPIPANDRPE